MLQYQKNNLTFLYLMTSFGNGVSKISFYLTQTLNERSYSTSGHYKAEMD